MVWVRIATAAALVLAFVPALFLLPDAWWIALCVTVVAACAWEWAALCRMRPLACSGFALLVAVLGEGFLFDPGLRIGLFVLAAAFWVTVIPFLLWRKAFQAAPLVRLAMGLVVLVPACLALIDLRRESPALLLAILAIAWISDSGAYFTGRAFGRRKLAPAISPGKTWEGAFGGLAGVAIYALVLLAVNDHLVLPAWLAGAAWSFVVLVLIWLCLAVAGILGDLAESWLKRVAGAKDSGKLLPGHGGLLDRVDALLPILPLAALIYFL